ncbi:low molecular weight phosphatase family protein [Kocuria palustris]|uniref:arsenate reductase/protein-tyrosine-phosphatase family protein n=1 Tax=Kocuria palustris TaxID=71999 RepID=UPI0011A299AA|nr:low molecular weight phosphatase family protein [Kocuria palustris]
MIRILAVCTGNVCRSPYLERRLQAALEETAPGGFEVRSTGTAALLGAPMEPGSRRELARRGIDGGSFRARDLEEAEVRAAQIVLTAELAHRRAVVELVPGALKRVFTVREFAALLEAQGALPEAGLRGGDGPRRSRTRWERLPDALAPLRAQVRSRALEVADPYRQGPEAFGRMARELDAAVETVTMWERRMRRG